MNRLKSFLFSIVLMAIAFSIVFLTALVYRANERSSIKSYIFQMNYFANQRAGELQDINDMPADELRNKLIEKYVSEYLRVVPGDSDADNRPMLQILSTDSVYAKWQDTEAKNIKDMSAKNMLRMVRVHDNGIVALNRPNNYDYAKAEIAKPIYYSVRYYTATWPDSNKMDENPIYEQGTLFIEAAFRPGIKENIYAVVNEKTKKMSLRKYLESGYNPVGLFKFTVTNIGDKEIR